MVEKILQAIRAIRAPLITDEYDLHRLTAQALAQAGIPCRHEASLAPRCRIDLLCGRVGIEIKRGKPAPRVLQRQLARYAQTGAVDDILLLCEHAVTLPDKIAGVRVTVISTSKLWGVVNAGEGLAPREGDPALQNADSALRAAREALGLQRAGAGQPDVFNQAAAPALQEADCGTETPAYLRDAPQTGRFFGTLSYNARRACWTVKGEPCVTELCKRLFPGTDMGKRGEARFTAHRRIVGDLNWLMLRYPLDVAPRDRERWRQAVAEARAYAALRTRMQEQPAFMQPPAGSFLGQLMPFQQAGLAWLVNTPRALLADEMGLGKTVQALCCLCAVRAFPALIIVPAHLVRNWAGEIARFIRISGKAPRVHIIKGLKPYALPEADIYLLHYLLLRGWKEVLPHLPFRCVVLDEAQELRRAGTEKYSAASLVCEKCERVIGLSGTPIYNQGGEIWNVVNILDYHFLGDFESFTREWCYGYGNNVVIKPDLLGEHLRREGLMLRRTKREVLPELPEKRRLVQEIDADDALYKRLMQPVKQKLLSLKKGDLTPSARALLTDQISQEERQATGLAKAQYVCQFVRALLEDGERVLLFAHHHAVMDAYKAELRAYRPVFITGRETGAAKEEAARRFMAGEANLCCVSLRAASGLNLQRATCVVFGELDWSPAVHSQAEDRAHRIGQKDSLLCYYLVCPGGSDADIQEALGLKVSQFLGLMGDIPQSASAAFAGADYARRHVERLLSRMDAEDPPDAGAREE